MTHPFPTRRSSDLIKGRLRRLSALEQCPEFHAERGKGGKAAEDADAQEQPCRLASAAAREPADQQPHGQAAGDVDRQRPPREARPEPRQHDLARSEEHTSELQSLMRISYAVFCLKKKKKKLTSKYKHQKTMTHI